MKGYSLIVVNPMFDNLNSLMREFADVINIDRFMELASKYTDFTELTTPMINEFVEKIIVHAPDKSTGR